MERVVRRPIKSYCPCALRWRSFQTHPLKKRNLSKSRMSKLRNRMQSAKSFTPRGSAAPVEACLNHSSQMRPERLSTHLKTATTSWTMWQTVRCLFLSSHGPPQGARPVLSPRALAAQTSEAKNLTLPSFWRSLRRKIADSPSKVATLSKARPNPWPRRVVLLASISRYREIR